MVAPGTNSGFAWEGFPDGFIHWESMKSAWRRSGPGVCQHCDGPTLLVNFGLRQVGMFNRRGFVEHLCGTCHRSSRDEIVDVKAWIVANLDAANLPESEMVWGKKVPLQIAMSPAHR